MPALGQDCDRIALTIQPPPAIALALSVGQGPAGPAGPAGSVNDYRHDQAAPSAVWTINHGLGRDVTVSLYTVGGLEFVGEVLQTSLNQCLVLLAAPAAGYARVI